MATGYGRNHKATAISMKENIKMIKSVALDNLDGKAETNIRVIILMI